MMYTIVYPHLQLQYFIGEIMIDQERFRATLFSNKPINDQFFVLDKLNTFGSVSKPIVPL